MTPYTDAELESELESLVNQLQQVEAGLMFIQKQLAERSEPPVDIPAYDVDCPNCGVSEGERCVETGSEGPKEGQYRHAHYERRELAHEVFVNE